MNDVGKRNDYHRARRDAARGGPARVPKDCAVDGPSVATARQHQRRAKKNGRPGNALLNACPYGCKEVWAAYQADQYQARKTNR